MQPVYEKKKREIKAKCDVLIYEYFSRYPKWAQGEWEESLIVKGTMTFNDLNGYHSYTFVTVESNHETGRYIVYSKNHW